MEVLFDKGGRVDYGRAGLRVARDGIWRCKCVWQKKRLRWHIFIAA